MICHDGMFVRAVACKYDVDVRLYFNSTDLCIVISFIDVDNLLKRIGSKKSKKVRI